MSNTAVVERVFEAINRGDVEAALAEAADDVVVDFSRSHSPYRGVYEGRGRVGRFWRDWLGSWEQLTWTPEQVTEVGDDLVLLVNHITGVGRGGIQVDARGGHVWRIAGGKVARMALFQTIEEARDCAESGGP